MEVFIVVLVMLVLSVILGFILTAMARDELGQGRKWFKILVGVGIVCGLGAFVFDEPIMGASLFGIAIISIISILYS